MAWRRGRRLPGEWQSYADRRKAKRTRQMIAMVTIFAGGFAAAFAVGMAVTRLDFDATRTGRPLLASTPSNRFTCTVTGVHDGDGPIYCAEGPKIRLTAIAARELDETCNSGHPCPSAAGTTARDELYRLARGQVLSCEQTSTSYSRVTAWCWRPDGVELNCAMVKSGKALAWTKFDPTGRMCRT